MDHLTAGFPCSDEIFILPGGKQNSTINPRAAASQPDAKEGGISLIPLLTGRLAEAWGGPLAGRGGGGAFHCPLQKSAPSPMTKIPQAQQHPRGPESGVLCPGLAVKSLLPPGGKEAHL